MWTKEYKWDESMQCLTQGHVDSIYSFLLMLCNYQYISWFNMSCFPSKPALVTPSNWLSIIVSLFCLDFPGVPCDCSGLVLLSSAFWICINEPAWIAVVPSSTSWPCHSQLQMDTCLPLYSLNLLHIQLHSLICPFVGSWNLW